MDWGGRKPPARFVVRQLASVAPFDQWSALEKYRAGYGVGAVSAVVLGEHSRGEAEDVRNVEAVVLPLDADSAAPTVASEGFQSESDTLTTGRRAASSLLGGRGLLLFVGLWLLGGRRPYPRWLNGALGIAWLAVGAMIAAMVVGPEPGDRLTTLTAALTILWIGLLLTAVTVVTVVGMRAWRSGRTWRALLEASQVRLHMNGGLKLQGGSAGLAFSLATLGAVFRANPAPARTSWLWRRFFRTPRAAMRSWAATGAITAGGAIEPVVVEPKLRACLLHQDIRDVLTPKQRDAGQRIIDRLAGELAPSTPERELARMSAARPRLGFASERRRLVGHRCRHLAQSVLAIGQVTSGWQSATNALALIVSAIMLLALPDLRDILRPPIPPALTGPASPSPYHLWVSLDTEHPEAFYVVLESGFWANRRSTVSAYGGEDNSVRAELRLNRLARPMEASEEDGTVWVERRRRFLLREFAPGERVGRYSFSYVAQLGRE